ncbi:MAG: hypothetical protein V3V01_15235 [Acidimicrobiales bacterium]
MGRLIVLEVNEVPLFIFRWYAQRKPQSAIASLLADGAVGETRNTDDLEGRELYPSQTWATLAMGVPLPQHKVFRYADPKPSDTPLYWEIASKESTVGVVGSLHSSPLKSQAELPGLEFCVPDTFAAEPATRPASLTALQRFSLSMTSSNSRAVSSTSPIRGYVNGVAAAGKARLRPATLLRLGILAGGVAANRIPRERLRTAHFVMMADVFERLLHRHDPDLAVFFTNHVAAAMHRYWYASFPDHWDTNLYSDEWCARFQDEIPAALDELDRVLARLLARCTSSGRALVIVSSMGQIGGEPLRDRSDEVFIVRSPSKFMNAIGVVEPFEIRSAMAPQVSAEFLTPEAARYQREKLDIAHGPHSGLDMEQRDRVLTIGYDIDVVGSSSPGTANSVRFAGTLWTASDLGGEIIAVDEHRNGMHHPVGSLICMNSTTARFQHDPVDAREVAPAILRALDIEPPTYQREPSFSL